MYLHEKNQQIETLRGVGNRKASSLRRLGIDTVRELLLYFPRDYLDRTRIVTLAAAPVERQATCLVRILSHEHTRLRRESILKVYVKDESANATLMCFGRSFLQYTLLPGKMFLINGVFQHSPRGGLQCSNFEFEEHSPVTEDYEKILPIYGLTSGLSQKVIRGSIREGLKTLGEQIGEELPGELRRRRRLADYSSALKNIHFPADWNAMQEARRYFIYHELFYLILTMKLRRSRRMQSRKRRVPIPFNLRDGLLSRLPFELTADQKQVLSEIEGDLFSPLPMARLIQGDVGCGKTLVALLAALSVIEAGEQAACMVPTELLARQHGDNAARFLEPLGVRVALLVGSRGSESRGSESRGKRQRALLLQALREGEIDLLIGTHALFSEDVRFHALGLAIIDEQHRFGVRQRFSLIGKGETPDLLMMSATPIPRSLALTAFGDLDISTIRTMPSGRKPVITHLARMGNEGKVYERVRREIHGGKQAYFVYPLISETEKSSSTPDDLKNAERMAQVL
ncbi:MAG TPA: ATP-dependent DNA helicase RecG, partial [Spirochaetia bacterium]|nr:ATP-dependent DNA helicase RecG [Spirochaetia bacterium]